MKRDSSTSLSSRYGLNSFGHEKRRGSNMQRHYIKHNCNTARTVHYDYGSSASATAITTTISHINAREFNESPGEKNLSWT